MRVLGKNFKLEYLYCPVTETHEKKTGKTEQKPKEYKKFCAFVNKVFKCRGTLADGTVSSSVGPSFLHIRDLICVISFS